jgi:hypothetical protein
MEERLVVLQPLRMVVSSHGMLQEGVGRRHINSVAKARRVVEGPRHCVDVVVANGGLSMPAALCKWFVPVVVSSFPALLAV